MTWTVLSDNRTHSSTLSTEHGLSVYLETDRYQLLLDTGASDVFIRKADVATNEGEIRELNKGFWEILVTLIRESRKEQHYSRPVTKSIDYITSHFNSKVTLEDLAKETELTPNYLATLFKHETGLTVVEYLTKFRIDSACALLSQTEYTYLQIALSLGFCTQSYFTKVFREHVGCTPRAYRQQHTDKAFSEFVR